jgi:uncharacterized protein with HEPN domain
MIKSYSKDIQLLMTILKNQKKIEETIAYFGCNQTNLEKNDMAFDLCAFYMAQIGEATKLLTEDTKNSIKCLDINILKAFRNMIDHTYEKVNKTYLKAYIFSIILPEAKKEIKDRIRFCNENAQG